MPTKKMTIETLAEMTPQEFLTLDKKMATNDDGTLILSAIENLSGQIAGVNVTHY